MVAGIRLQEGFAWCCFEELKSRAFKSGSEPLEPAVEHVQPLNKSEDVERA